MKIAMLSTYPPKKCGIGIYTNSLVSAIKKKLIVDDSNDVSIITIGDLKSSADYKVDFRSLSLKKELNNIIKKENVDVLHIQYIAAFYGKYTFNIGLINALSLDLPIVVTLHEVQYSSNGLKNKVLAFLEKQIVKKANLIITHTGKQRDFINQKYNTDKSKTVFMGITPLEVQSDVGKNLLFFGMISKGKGLDILIKAMDKLEGYKLTIAGRFVDDEHKLEILSLIKKSTCKNDIETYLEWISNEKKDELFRKSNMLVLPYIWAPYQSAVLHDAFSYRKPVVITRTGAVWEVVDEFNAGVVVRAEDVDALVDGINRTFNNYDPFLSGVDKYRKEANWLVLAEQYLEIYKGKNGS